MRVRVTLIGWFSRLVTVGNFRDNFASFGKVYYFTNTSNQEHSNLGPLKMKWDEVRDVNFCLDGATTCAPDRQLKLVFLAFCLQCVCLCTTLCVYMCVCMCVQWNYLDSTHIGLIFFSISMYTVSGICLADAFNSEMTTSSLQRVRILNLSHILNCLQMRIQKYVFYVPGYVQINFFINVSNNMSQIMVLVLPVKSPTLCDHPQVFF